jgi:AraC-like DNA-binding protein
VAGRAIRLDQRIRFTLNVIAQHDCSPRVGLSETSTLLGISEAYLLRLFHQEVGKTFRKYLREMRMKRAAELVKDSPQSLKEIALRCGYNDVSNFHRDFKIVYATTPRKFRLKGLPVAPASQTAVAGK